MFEDALYAIRTAKAAGFHIVGLYDLSSADEQEEIKRLSEIYREKLTDATDMIEFMQKAD